MSRHERLQPVYAMIRESLTDALDELAVDMKTDPQGALNDLLEVALDGDALFARSLLKVERRVAGRPLA